MKTVRNLEVVFQSSRCAVVRLNGVGKYYAEKSYKIHIHAANEREAVCVETDKTVTTLYGLKPNQEYCVFAEYDGEKTNTVEFKTDWEYVTLNVRDFGAAGDGVHDDTNAIQAAIMACPPNSRVLIPSGKYKVKSLFLKSDVNIHLNKGAVLCGCTEREKLPILPAVIETYDENDEYNLGSYGGNPTDVFAALITGIYVKNVTITGEGMIDGCADFDTWWKNPKKRNIAYRPRLIFLNHCENITLQGITVTHSPHWNVHPYFSKRIRCIDVKIINPQDSPNTDGFNPESSEDVLVLGTYISVGDDCIAVKSGNMYMATKNPVPTKNLLIANCCMRDGHGAVTIGSENASGIVDVRVENCDFINTDRGLRIKTRRGRGEKSVIENIVFRNIYMDGVMTPIVVNSFYYCGVDGKTDYVGSLEPLPVDERTPSIKSLAFYDIKAVNCHVAAAYMYGLPERKIDSIVLENVDISYASEVKKGVAAMMKHCEPTAKAGIVAANVKELVMNNVTVTGNAGETYLLENVDAVCGNSAP